MFLDEFYFEILKRFYALGSKRALFSECQSVCEVSKQAGVVSEELGKN